MTDIPHEMTKEEALVRLCDAARTSADPEFLRAAVIAAKCLARAGIHKRRNHAARVARGKDARLSTPEPSAPTPDAAEPQTQE
jgi:hypothetical protein